MLYQKRKYPLITKLVPSWLIVGNDMGKTAIITVRLVDESIINSNETIAKEMLTWLKEDSLVAPWIKQVDTVVVEGSQPQKTT